MHDVAGRLLVEPMHRKALDLFVELASQIMDDALLECAIAQISAHRDDLSGSDRADAQSRERNDAIHLLIGHNVIDENLGNARQDEHQQRAQDGESQSGGCMPRVARGVPKYAEERRHRKGGG